MADSLGQLEDQLSLREFIGTNRFIVLGQSAGALRWQGGRTTTLTMALGEFALGTEATFVNSTDKTFAQPDIKSHDGDVDDRWDEADVWFDQAIVRPLTMDFGNILSTQNDTIMVYSSYRSVDITLNSVVNNLGTGVNLTGIPTLPYTLQPQSGFDVGVEVTMDGSPILNDTIDFVFNVSTSYVLVTGQRIIMFAFRPEVPLSESIDFLTDVIEHVDGSEQRIASRKHPRQVFSFKMAVEENERRYIENLLYDWQSRVFGLPIWTEPAFMIADATAGAYSVQVDDTTLSDFREEGLAIIFTDRYTFDALEIQTLAANVITFTSPLMNSYPAGTQVLPLRTAIAAQRIRGTRGLIDDENLNIEFRVLDNNVGSSFADASAFSSLNSKILLDGPNAVQGRMSETLQRRMIDFDNQTGKRSATSPWTRGRRSSVKGFVTHSRQELWNVRRLIHELQGKQVSFYLPTFYDEFELTTLLQSGSQILNVVNVGFAKFAESRAPSRSILRVIETDGTIHTRNITSAGEIDSQNEQVVVDVAWPNDIQISEVERIEYVELVRADTDKFKIEHHNAIGDAKIFFPVKAVFE
jgi:hypothetical protein